MRQVMVRGLKRVDQMFVLGMTSHCAGVTMPYIKSAWTVSPSATSCLLRRARTDSSLGRADQAPGSDQLARAVRHRRVQTVGV
ncbi:hypothetical protein CJO94_19095 (plasmid) [Ralstonia solanacearum]|nr:hypothetical protein CJO94_19095 [Ralstonia solanacearum]